MSLIYREIYVGCGERQDGRWNVIVIPPGGARDDVRVVQPDLDILEAAEIARAIARTSTRASAGGGLLRR